MLLHHHHHVTQSSHSINAIGPALMLLVRQVYSCGVLARLLLLLSLASRHAEAFVQELLHLAVTCSAGVCMILQASGLRLRKPE
jgi:hypothetical protein